VRRSLSHVRLGDWVIPAPTTFEQQIPRCARNDKGLGIISNR
jgi:hypothetical protein